MRRPGGCQESVRRPGGGSELTGVQEESEVLEFVIKNGGQAKSSQRMEDDSSLERFSKGIKNVPEGWKMRNKEKDLQGFQKMSIEKGIIP